MAAASINFFSISFALLSLILLIPGFLGQSPSVLETYSIPEESPRNTFVGDLSVLPEISSLDDEVASKMQYRLLKQGNELAEFFEVQEADGVIHTAGKLDRDAICPGQHQCRVDLGIMASSPPDTFKHLTIGVNIMDVNDNIPEFQTSRIERTIPESTTIGSSFSIPTARDPDSPKYGVGGYRLVSGMSDFQLKVTNVSNSISLYLVLQTAVDREVKERYDCVVAAADKMDTSKSGTLTVDIIIADINDHAPQFESQTYSASVPEDVGSDTVITTVKAMDLDSGVNGEIIYGFSSQMDQDVLQVFQIDSSTGDITVAGTLDYEKKRVYTLVVTARDISDQWLPSEAKVTVTVEDVNDHHPQVTVSDINGNNNISVPEDARPGTFLAYLMVQDMDSGVNGHVDCYMGEESFSLHQESPTTYSLHTASALDRETVSAYSLTFLCQDRGDEPLSSTTVISVSVQDINDNDPHFALAQYTAVLAENNAIGATVVKTSADDLDSGPYGLVTYSLDETSKNWLDIDAVTGVITAKQPFDYEQFHNFTAQVMAFDHGQPPRSSEATLVIHLLDTNDQPPEFLQAVYELQVEENLEGGAFVGQVFAEDRDLPPHNTFGFSLETEAGVFNPFSVDSTTGIIYTNAILDREFKAHYSIIVLAIDDKEPSLSSSASVQISISDVNDNSPQITFPAGLNDTIQISNLTPVGFALPKIQAADPDNGRNGTLIFSLVSGNEKEYFSLDAESGVLSVQRTLSHIATENVSLHILVQDSGFSPLKSEAVLTIVVNRSVELPPGVLDSATESLSDGGRDKLVSDSNLAIVIAVATVSTVVIIILLVAIVIVRKQEQKRKQQKNMTRLIFDQRVTIDRDGETEEDGENSTYSKSNGHGYTNELVTADGCSQHLQQQKKVNNTSRSSSRSLGRSQELPKLKQASDASLQPQDPSLILSPEFYHQQTQGTSGHPSASHLYPTPPPPWGYDPANAQVAPSVGLRLDHDALSANSDESTADSGRGSNEDGSSGRSHADLDHSFSRGLNTSRSSYHGYQQPRHSYHSYHRSRRSSHGHPPQRSCSSSNPSRNQWTNQNVTPPDHMTGLHHHHQQQPSHSHPHMNNAHPQLPPKTYKSARSTDNVHNQWDRQDLGRETSHNISGLPGLSSSKV